MRFTSKVCVITGASSGIGRRTALDLAARGARVCAAARREDRLRALVDEIGGAEAGHSYEVVDVSRPEGAVRLGRHVAEIHGRCDVLVNNAGISSRGTFDEPDALDALDRVMATNFFGAVRCTKALLPLLLASAPSNVVNVASVAGRLAVSPSYSASKFALCGWSEALHRELAARGVAVSVVEPGPLPTEAWPHARLAAHPVLRHSLTDVAAVSRTIQDAIVAGKVQRVVPRWYYLFYVLRVLAPPLFRLGRGRVIGRGGH